MNNMNIIIERANNYEFEELYMVEKEDWGKDLSDPDYLRASLIIFPAGYFVAPVDVTAAGAFVTIAMSYN